MTPSRTPIDPECLAAQAEWLQRLARQLVGDSDRASDLAQETMLVALERPPLGAGPSLGEDGLRAWLYGVARNVARVGRRLEARRSEREGVYRSRRPAEAPSSGDVVARAAEQRRLVDAVLRLEEPYRTAVLLAYEERLKAPAIAERMGITPVAARKRISRGLAQLRARLDEQEGGDRAAWMASFSALLAPPAKAFGGFGGAVLIGKGMAALAATIALVALGVWGWNARPDLESRREALTPGGNPVELAAGSRAGEPIAPEDRTRTKAAEPAVADQSSVRAGAAIRGRVLYGSGGTPVAGAEIWASTEGDQGLNKSELLVLADEAGEFLLEPSLAQGILDAGLWVDHAEAFPVHVDGVQVSAAQGEVLVIRTVPLGSVLVRVLDADGEPLPDQGIAYSVEPTIGSERQLWGYRRDFLAGQSDPNGELTVRGLPTGMELSFGVEGEWASQAKVVIEESVRHAVVVLRPRAWGSIQARILQPGGAPAAQMRMTWRGTASRGRMRGTSASPDAEGVARIRDLAAGAGLVTFRGEGYHRSVHARIELGEVTDLGEIQLEEKGPVAGRVRTRSGALPPVGYWVMAFRDGEPVGQVQPDQAGEFELLVPHGRVLLAATKRATWDPEMPYRGEFVGQVEVQAPAADIELLLETELCSITGSLDGAGTEVQVLVFDPQPAVAWGNPIAQSSSDSGLALGASGRFAWSTTPQAQCRILVCDGSGRSYYSEAQPILAGQEIDLGDVELGTSDLVVQARDGSGQALDDVVVTVMDFRRDKQAKRTEEGLGARFELAPGPYAVRAAGPGQTSGAWQLVQVEMGAANQTGIVLMGEALLAGRVDSEAGPQAGVVIHAQRSQPPSNLSWSATTGADGRFAFQPLMPGTYRYWIGGHLTGHVDLHAGASRELVLDQQEARHSVRLVAGGSPLAGMGILQVSEQGSSPSPWRKGKKMSGGRYGVHLPAGPLLFQISPNGLGNNQLLVVPGPPAAGLDYELSMPDTGIELRLSATSGLRPVPAAYLKAFDGEPVSTSWGVGCELYQEPSVVQPGGDRAVRFPYIPAGAEVLLKGLGDDGQAREERVQVLSGTWTVVSW